MLANLAGPGEGDLSDLLITVEKHRALLLRLHEAPGQDSAWKLCKTIN